MSIHEKLAASIKDLTAAHAAEIMGVGDECCGPNPCIDCIIGAIKCGLFSDILGVREPTIEDVRREAVRVFGNQWTADDHNFGDPPESVTIWKDSVDYDGNPPLIAPTVAAAYASLLSMPDYEVSK